jgi:phosphotransferase system enzyme I (PtsP)
MLDILRRIIQEVNAAPDLQKALDIIVQRVRVNVGVDVASVYLLDDEHNQYVLMATEGFRKDAIGKVRIDKGKGLIGMVADREEPVNLDDAPSHPQYLFIVETGEKPYHGFLGVPIIQYRKVLGVLVVRQREYRKFGEEEEAFLVTLAAQLAGAITHAGASGEISRLLEERDEISVTLRGLPGAPGLAIGQAMVVYPPANLDAIPDRKPADIEAEVESFYEATAAVQDDLRDYSNRMSGLLPAEDLALFDALLLMLDSDSLVTKTVERIRGGNWAPGALRQTIAEHVQVFETMEDAYLRERASDIRDLGRRIVTHIQSDRPAPRPAYSSTVLVGKEISVGQLAEIPVEHLAGIVSTSGSSSSHVAILAQALGIPAVMGVEELPVARLEGQTLIADGYRGEVFVRPSELLRSEFLRLQAEESALIRGLKELADQPSVTPDGVSVPLYLNTGLVFSDIESSMHSECDGVGLYRTEIPFLMRQQFPGEEEQLRIYRKALEAFAPRPVTLRTLDVGGDKMLSYFPVKEDNPFLGWRGIRISLDHPEIFLTQLRAMLRASVGLDNLTILLPMVSTVTEIDIAMTFISQALGELIEEGMEVYRPPIGVMIEVPSAVYQVAAMAQRVDFFSIGTNDLTQYVMAADRGNPRVAALASAFQPSVLRMVRDAASAARAAGIWIGMCGELAGNPLATPVLLGLGLDELSMSAPAIPAVKEAVRRLTMPDARRIAAEALAADSAEAVLSLLKGL